MSKRDADQLVKDLKAHLKAEGSELEITKRGNHWHVVTPDGHSLANFGSTPSDGRFRKNAIAQLRRREIIPPDWRG